MSRKLSSLALPPWVISGGVVTAGCEPDEMGIGPVSAVPELLQRAGLGVEDIDLWELNEAFAPQCVHCRDSLGIDKGRYNVSGRPTTPSLYWVQR